MYNIQNSKHILSASISSQCCKDYFYGKDQIMEAALCSLEGEASRIFRDAIDLGALPKAFTVEWRLLYDLIAIQHGRTEAEVENLNSVVDQFAKYMLANAHPEIKTDGMKIGWKDAAQISTVNALSVAPILNDLQCKVLVARNAEFILSDNPVVMFNQAFDHRVHVSAVGIAMQGLQIYLPISANTALFFYDANFYQFPRRSSTCTVFPVDIKELNALQYINARRNVYYRGADTGKYIDDFAASGLAGCASELFKVVTLEQEGSRRRDLVMTARPRLSYMPRFRFISPTRKRVSSRPGVRDPLWTAIVTEFTELMEQGQRKYEEFGAFVADHPLTPGVGWLRAALIPGV